MEIDLPSIGLRLPPLFLQRMMSMLAHLHGGMWDAEYLGRSLGAKGQTLRHYRDFLEKTYFLRVLPPFFSSTKKKIVKTPKIYFRDTGILHYLSRIEDFNALLSHPIVGNFMGRLHHRTSSRIFKRQTALHVRNIFLQNKRRYGM